MVSREKRDLARCLLGRFLKGEITDERLADSYPRDKKDAAIGAIYERLWGYWDDGWTGGPAVRVELQGEARARTKIEERAELVGRQRFAINRRACYIRLRM